MPVRKAEPHATVASINETEDREVAMRKAAGSVDQGVHTSTGQTHGQSTAHDDDGIDITQDDTAPRRKEPRGPHTDDSAWAEEYMSGAGLGPEEITRGMRVRRIAPSLQPLNEIRVTLSTDPDISQWSGAEVRINGHDWGSDGVRCIADNILRFCSDLIHICSHRGDARPFAVRAAGKQSVCTRVHRVLWPLAVWYTSTSSAAFAAHK